MLGVFDVGFYNLEQMKAKVKVILPSMRTGLLEEAIKRITQAFSKTFPFVYYIKPEYQLAF